jgi:hypothetical protein
LGVEFADNLFRDRTLHEFDKGEPPRSAGLAIHRHDDVRRFGDGGEVGSKIRFTRSVRKIPDEQTDCQGSL